jgi:hypothetical protein
MVNNTMRLLLIVVSLLALSGCETLSEAIENRDYSVNLYESENVKQGFGYFKQPRRSDVKYKYIGYQISGEFE